ncbi:MAG: CapA family protein [Gemmatimonadetes bacterium]|nr:CapA family protein [Gemmatimonadota bacterium]
MRRRDKVEDGIQLALVGDTALGGSLGGIPVPALAERSASVVELLQEADLRFLSLDCAIGRHGDPVYPDEYVIDCEQETLALLKQWGIDVVSLANNHSTDRGLESLLAGRGQLLDTGIAVVGAGSTAAEASSAAIVECQGLKIGWLAFASTHPWVGAYAATDDHAGIAELDEARVLTAVESTRSQVDALIVSVHWGKEYICVPPPSSVRFARKLIDAGVRVVVGHHPHIIQPVESYGQGVICYSLGNFLFPDYPGQGLHFGGTASESLLVRVHVDKQRAVLRDTIAIGCDADGRLRSLPSQRQEQIMAAQAHMRPELGTHRGDRAWQRAVRQHEVARMQRVLRKEVLDAGFRDGTVRLLRLGRKNLWSLTRSLREILGGGQR